ncbi:MAG: hypothetical protein JXA93_18935 [Anaerolineae bacterium]|nr:hypothetical protein [Anaerolineae bacterium]
MEKRKTLIIGTTLVLFGLLSLSCSGMSLLLGLDVLGLVWRLWPGIVIVLGLLFIAAPLLAPSKRGLGALFIPGMVVLTTGGLLLFASIFDAWKIWATLWPMMLISLATGFLFAAAYMRISGLLIPAVILGLNGLVFQFCALTGLWSWWSVLWVIEPLSVGLALLTVGALGRKSGIITAGLIVCGVAAVGFLLMISILGDWWPLRLVGPLFIILAGAALLAWNTLRGRLLPRSATE